MIVDAKEGGAHAVKFQTYKAEKLASKNSPYYWDLKEKSKNQYHLFKKYDFFNEKEYINLAKYCDDYKIDFLSTPFDDEAIEFLNPNEYYKIASTDLTNVPFLKKLH